MIAAFAPFETLPRFRMIRTDGFRASCPTPAHRHGDRSRGLSGRSIGNKIVLKCFSGCPTAEILQSLGLDWSALFLDDRGHHRQANHHADIRRRAAEGLAVWRDSELLRIAVELRTRDSIARSINDAVNAGTITIDTAMDLLADQYHCYSELDFTFEILRTGSPAEVAELWSAHHAN